MRQKEKKEQELEEKLQRRLSGAEELKELFFLVWPVVASKKQRIYPAFSFFLQSIDCPKLESYQWPGMTSQTALYPDFFK